MFPLSSCTRFRLTIPLGIRQLRGITPPTRSLTFDQILPVPFVVQVVFLGKVSIQAHISLRIQFLNKGNNSENDRLPLGLLE